MVECKYYSFYALAKINDPELLFDAFQQQIAPGQQFMAVAQVAAVGGAEFLLVDGLARVELNVPVAGLGRIRRRLGRGMAAGRRCSATAGLATG